MANMLHRRQCRGGCCGGDWDKDRQRWSEKRHVSDEIHTELNSMRDDYEEFLLLDSL